MNRLIKIKQAVIVEGKYDKITLSNIIDTLIISTNGFSIFKDREKRELIKTLSLKDGIVVMTDSDSAGRMIRSHIKQICPDGKIINVYIPQIKGKEKRKEKSSKEGLLGVEGMSQEIIEEALKRSGVTAQKTETPKEKITVSDLYILGLSGKNNSSLLRNAVCEHLTLPTGFRGNAFLDLINTLFEREEFIKKVKLCLQEVGRN